MGKPRQSSSSGKSPDSASKSLNAVKSRPHKRQKAKNPPQPAAANPQTCCSNCQTVFEVSLELLSTADTRVRCGECLSIFDALANLRDISLDADSSLSLTASQATSAQIEDVKAKRRSQLAREAEAPQAKSEDRDERRVDATMLADLINDTSVMDVTYSDFDLFSEDSGLPDVQFDDDPRHDTQLYFDDVEDVKDETFSDTLFVEDETVNADVVTHQKERKTARNGLGVAGDVGFVTDDAPTKPLVFNYRDSDANLDSLQFPEEVTHGEEVAHSRYDASPVPVYSESEKKVVAAASSTKPNKAKPASSGRTKEAGGIKVPTVRRNPWKLRGALFCVVMLLATGLYAYRERTAMLNNGFFRPILSAACGVFSCRLPDRIDLNALRAVDRSVVSHPTVPNALIIKFGIVNQASFSQPHPVLEIRLTDRAGRLVVTNRFNPNEYLRDWQAGDVLDVGKRLDIGLAVQDPGNTAMSFELDFLKVK